MPTATLAAAPAATTTASAPAPAVKTPDFYIYTGSGTTAQAMEYVYKDKERFDGSAPASIRVPAGNIENEVGKPLPSGDVCYTRSSSRTLRRVAVAGTQPDRGGFHRLAKNNGGDE